jgi:hypothetical protein
MLLPGNLEQTSAEEAPSTRGRAVMDKTQHLGSDFTTDALCIIDQLQERAAARSLSLNAYLPKLLLWTILQWEKKVAIAALEQMGVNRWKLAQDLDHFLRIHHSTDSVTYPLETVRQWASQQATFLGTDWKGTEHLLLAAIAFAGPKFRSFLATEGIDYEPAKKAILTILAPHE